MTKSRVLTLALTMLGALLVLPAPATAAGAAPTGVHVAVTGPGFLQWVWQATPNAAEYRVAVDTSRTMSSPEVRTVTGRWMTKIHLDRNTVYYVSVRALTASGLSAPSPVVAGRTSTVPVGLRSVEQTVTKLTWTWIEFKDAVRYEIRLSSSPSFAAYRSRVVSSAVPMYWYGLKPGTTYYAKVRGLNQDWSPFTGWSAVRSAATTSP